MSSSSKVSSDAPTAKHWFSSRWYRAARRFNVFVMAAAGMAALVLLVVLLCMTAVALVNSVSPAQESERITLNPDASDKAAQRTFEWRVGRFDTIAGTSYLVASLSAEPKAEKGMKFSSYSKSYDEEQAVCNFLFVDAKTRNGRWLVDENKYLFLSADSIKRNDKAGAPLVAWRYSIVSADTNNDGSLTRADTRSIAFALPDSTRFQTIIPDADDVLGSSWLDKQRFVLLYRVRNGDSFASEINVERLQVVETKPLPAVPGKNQP